MVVNGVVEGRSQAGGPAGVLMAFGPKAMGAGADVVVHDVVPLGGERFVRLVVRVAAGE